ncbi:4-phosphoerythronate dehydrogenase [Parahaliea aestuarii]|uniref:Erythronate-4-phosphate dehydrogenase n=1 Tax=Parahaliea aestuarii TaxID=1852021 RepID=A0A5C8ZR89_9GAMM|nr:4-phosphoerythronate dehydrogenase [Parahaliea aestuarii]TXS90988.1 4-phosphoerythronate dehydrogenase [Parahaliea aestuarii]
MSGLKIIADANMRGVEAVFQPYGEVHLVEGRSLRRQDLQGADVLLVRSVTSVDSELLRGTGVRFVGTATSGLEHVDGHYLAEQGIRFAHARGSNANAVVEYDLAAIAACDDYLERLLDGGVLGIVGQGHVGAALARCARALGIRIRCHDPWLESVEDQADLAAVLAADVICLHPELTRRKPHPSYHLLNADRLAQVSGDSLLINTSRGAVVDNAALCERLQQGRGPACVLDVWEHEPHLQPGLLEQVRLGTPHIAGHSLDAKLEGTRMLGAALATAFDLAPPGVPREAGGAPTLSAPQELAGSALLRWLLSARYDIGADDAALRHAVTGPGTAATPAAVAAAFDDLRRHYPQRRELRGSPVCAPSAPEAWASALGYQPVAAESTR